MRLGRSVLAPTVTSRKPFRLSWPPVLQTLQPSVQTSGTSSCPTDLCDILCKDADCGCANAAVCRTFRARKRSIFKALVAFEILEIRTELLWVVLSVRSWAAWNSGCDVLCLSAVGSDMLVPIMVRPPPGAKRRNRR
jgi:hypothetical protein